MSHGFLAPLTRAGVALLLLASGCGREPSPPPQPDRVAEFDATNAFRHVERLVAFGPRLPSTPAFEQARRYLETELLSYGLQVESQVFEDDTPLGRKKFCNLIAHPPGRGGERIVLGSHYDCKHLEGIHFLGANDSGSSTGLLLELARVLARHPMQPTPYFVFFDGEESFGEWSATDGLYGSRYLVRAWKQDGQLAAVRAMILMDMVGDRHLHVTIPPHSSPPLVRAIFDAATQLGYRDHFGYATTNFEDDHVPFLRAGIPAILLIDFEFGSAPGLNDYWHTEHDTLDKLSPRSLEIVGRTVLRALPRIARDLAPSR